MLLSPPELIHISATIFYTQLLFSLGEEFFNDGYPQYQRFCILLRCRLQVKLFGCSKDVFQDSRKEKAMSNL